MAITTKSSIRVNAVDLFGNLGIDIPFIKLLLNFYYIKGQDSLSVNKRLCFNFPDFHSYSLNID